MQVGAPAKFLGDLVPPLTPIAASVTVTVRWSCEIKVWRDPRRKPPVDPEGITTKSYRIGYVVLCVAGSLTG